MPIGAGGGAERRLSSHSEGRRLTDVVVDGLGFLDASRVPDGALPIRMHVLPAALGICPGGQTRRLPGRSEEEGGRQAPSTRRMPGGHGLGEEPPGTTGITGLATLGGRQAWGFFGSTPAGQSRGTHLGSGVLISCSPVTGSLST
jgi:hypothetical protein